MATLTVKVMICHQEYPERVVSMVARERQQTEADTANSIGVRAGKFSAREEQTSKEDMATPGH